MEWIPGNMNDRLKFILLLSLSLAVLQTPLAQEIEIYGVVLDQETGAPLENAHVYISNTTHGTTTDSAGQFTLQVSIRGTFTIAASFVGYGTISQSIEIVPRKNVRLQFLLTPKIVELEEINVSSKTDRKWQKSYTLFREFFIGTDEFAEQTEILNPEVLEFHKKWFRNSTTVISKRPLQIKNDALGYLLVVEILEMSFDETNKGGIWSVLTQVSEMDPLNDLQQETWKQNRQKAYLGSQIHFFKSLYSNTLPENGFYPYIYNYGIGEVIDKPRIRSYFPQNFDEISANYKVYLNGGNRVGYIYNPTMDELGAEHPIWDRLDYFIIRNEHNVFAINDLGFLYNFRSLEFYGSWGDNRFSKFIPLNYEPPSE